MQGVSLDVSTAGSIARSLQALREGCTDKAVMEVVTLLATKPMKVCATCSSFCLLLATTSCCPLINTLPEFTQSMDSVLLLQKHSGTFFVVQSRAQAKSEPVTAISADVYSHAHHPDLCGHQCACIPHAPVPCCCTL